MIRIVGHLQDPEPLLTAGVSELASRAFEELEQLPPWIDLGSERDGITFGQHRKTLPDGRLEVVVQAYRPSRRLLFIELGQMAAQGLWITPDGTVELMPQRALDDYT